MPQIIDILRVTVLPETLLARVRVADDAPLTTDEDPEGTERVLDLIPELESHVCLGDISPDFGEVAQMTEVAHLLEHVSVEIMARTEMGGDISCGRTRQVSDDPRVFEIELDCPDDVLGAGALSSAAWILEWAYTGGGDPTPDVEGIAAGLVQLVDELPEVEDIVVEPETVEEEVAEEEAEPEADATRVVPALTEEDIAETDAEEPSASGEVVVEDGIAVMTSAPAVAEPAAAEPAQDATAQDEDEDGTYDDPVQINWFGSYGELMKNLEKKSE